jgi:hypothetical protein
MGFSGVAIFQRLPDRLEDLGIGAQAVDLGGGGQQVGKGRACRNHLADRIWIERIDRLRLDEIWRMGQDVRQSGPGVPFQARDVPDREIVGDVESFDAASIGFLSGAVVDVFEVLGIREKELRSRQRRPGIERRKQTGRERLHELDVVMGTPRFSHFEPRLLPTSKHGLGTASVEGVMGVNRPRGNFAASPM